MSVDSTSVRIGACGGTSIEDGVAPSVMTVAETEENLARSVRPLYELLCDEIGAGFEARPRTLIERELGGVPARGRGRQSLDSAGAFAEQHHPHRLEQDHEIQEERVVLDVVEVVLELLRRVLH